MTGTPTHPATPRPDVPLTLAEAGAGRPALILHGGGGPFTVASLAGHLATTMRAITPTHPGWDGTPRPTWLTGIADLALVYLRYLEEHDLRDVLIVGSSLGGWIGAEMALHDGAGRITGLILIDAVGIAVDGEPIRDFFALDARGVAEYSFHDADRFYRDPRRTGRPSAGQHVHDARHRRRPVHARAHAPETPRTDPHPRARCLGRQRPDRDPGLRCRLRRRVP